MFTVNPERVIIPVRSILLLGVEDETAQLAAVVPVIKIHDKVAEAPCGKDNTKFAPELFTVTITDAVALAFRILKD